MTDKDDQIDPLADDDDDAELRAAIEKALNSGNETDAEDSSIDAPLDEPESSVISHEDGLNLVDKARHGKIKPEKEPDPEPEQQEPEPQPDPEPANLEAAEAATLLDGIDPARAKELSRRLEGATRITDLFKGHEAELQLHGATPETAVARFLELNRFAQEKPDEYVAWVATQTGGAEPHKVLAKAAEKLGYKLVANEVEDDPFLDPEAKALKEENARLKAQLGGQQPGFGPDTPERVQQREAQRQLNEFITARDPQTGQPLRPHFQQLQPRIGQLAAQHVQNTQKAVTVDDLARFYDQAQAEVLQIAGVSAPAATSAAQAKPAVPDQIQQKAAAAQKAQLASKSIDGTGHGASRRPALPADAPLEAVIRYHAKLGQ